MLTLFESENLFEELRPNYTVRFLFTILSCDFCCSRGSPGMKNRIRLSSFNTDCGYDMSQGFKTCFYMLQHISCCVRLSQSCRRYYLDDTIHVVGVPLVDCTDVMMISKNCIV